MKTIETLTSTLDGLKMGDPVTHGALTVHPLTGGAGDAPDLDLLEDALRAGAIEIEELDDDGSVPELRVTNAGRNPVLILEGDELIGLKQNRTVNSSVLVSAGTSLVLPVSCVERGRWSRSSSRLSRSTSTSHLALRRLKSRSVHASLRERSDHRSDQGAVWAEVDRKSVRHGHHSGTSALHDARLSLESDLAEFREIPGKLPDGVRAVIVSIAERPVALELLPDARTFSKAAERLVSGYALEALEYEGVRVDSVPASDLLARLTEVRYEEHAAVGVGLDVRFDGEDVSGYALLDGERVLHATAFVGEG